MLDVNLLHEIVLRAQARDDALKRPNKALFDAYEAVFSEHGLDTSHDRACLRVLLQMGGPGVQGSSLYEKFESLLVRFGISLLFADDEVSVLADANDASEMQGEAAEEHVVADMQRPIFTPARRNSFTSMYDATHELSRNFKRRSLSQSSFSKVRATEPRILSLSGGGSTINGQPPDLQAPCTELNVQHDRDWSARFGTRVDKVPGPARESRPHSANGVDESHTEDSVSSIASRPDPQDLLSETSLPRTPHDALSETRLLQDAVRFDDLRLRLMTLRRWMIKTRERRHQHQTLVLDATNKDRLTLQRQAFDRWRVAHLRIQQKLQIDHFYSHLSRRAGRAYDRYLLAKAFSHWYEIAIEGIVKTNVARQRYLYTKYFNAWHELTVSDELKAERQSFQAPFRLLRRKAAQYYNDQINSLAVYHNNLTRYVFWRWLREFCDRIAPRVRDRQLKKRTLTHWSRKFQWRVAEEKRVEARHQESKTRAVFHAWATKTRIDVAGYGQADAFKSDRLLNFSLQWWRMEAMLSPREGQVSRMRDWRVARSCFSVWLSRFQLTSKADTVSRLRMKQDAFSGWNEQLRIMMLQSRIAERIVAVPLYKWVVAQRQILTIRVHDQTLKREALHKWRHAFRALTSRLSTQEAQVTNGHQVRFLTSTIQRWRLQVGLCWARSQRALDFYAPKAQQDILNVWQNRLQDVQKFERWSSKAELYFMTKKYLKQWQASTAKAKKKRLKESCAETKRNLKMRLARRTLTIWHARVDQVRIMRIRAAEAYHGREGYRVRAVLDHWHDGADYRRRSLSDASTRYENRITHDSLQSLADAALHIRNMHTQADQLYEDHRAKICSIQLRKLSMKAFGVQLRHRDADAMRERHWTKHLKFIFQHWAAKSREVTLQARLGDPSPSVEQETDTGYGTASNDDPPAPASVGFGATQRAEEWTAFDADFLDSGEWIPPPDEVPQATSTPMPTPGYLNTPFKRAARARVLAHLSTTPATPLTTPFAARLSAGVASSSSPSQPRITTARRGGFSRSALGSSMSTVEYKPSEALRDGKVS